MRIFLLKNAVKKSLLNSRYVFRNSSSIAFNPSLYIPKRHLQLDNTKKLPLVRRLYGNNNDGGDKRHYFSLLSTKNLSPEKQLCLPFPNIEVVGSCNGVVCLEDEETEGKAVLWNPSSNEFKFLPPSCIQRHPCAADIVFCSSGFGFDRNSQDYKVIRFVDIVFETDEGYYDRIESHAELYSLMSDSWTEIYNPTDLEPWSSSSAYVNGVFYWVATGDTQDDILSFEFANHKFSTFGFPESVAYCCYLFKKSFDLWVRNDESWGRVSIFPVSGAVGPLGFWTKDQLLFESTNHDLKVFDFATREVEHLHIYDYPDTLKFIPCAESRVQLNGKSEFENKEPSKEDAFH